MWEMAAHRGRRIWRDQSPCARFNLALIFSAAAKRQDQRVTRNPINTGTTARLLLQNVCLFPTPLPPALGRIERAVYPHNLVNTERVR